MHINRGLKPDDYNRRYDFCAWFINQCRNSRFLANFVIGDEASFAMVGKIFQISGTRKLIVGKR